MITITTGYYSSVGLNAYSGTIDEHKGMIAVLLAFNLMMAMWDEN